MTAHNEQSIVMTGEMPGEGTYRCINCGKTITLNYHLDLLPNCQTCFGMEFCVAEEEESWRNESIR